MVANTKHEHDDPVRIHVHVQVYVVLHYYVQMHSVYMDIFQKW